jgi:hypothetical protein
MATHTSRRKAADKQTTARRGEAREPRLPHERDESADSQRTQAPRPSMRRAAADIAAGRTDTDSGPVLDQTYQRLKRGR